MKLLLHICCANCACYPLKVLKEKDIQVTGFWYNPNIHPYTEHQKRLMTMGYYSDRENLSVTYRNEYGLESWLKEIGGTTGPGEERCGICYRMRISETARTASEKGFDSFTTTLLYSKKQNKQLIRTICEKASGEYGVEIYFKDFDKGWKDAIDMSKSMGLYRQQYCGCIFSEKERYEKKDK